MFLRLKKKKLTYIINLNEYFIYLKQQEIKNYIQVGLYLVKDMLNYNGIIVNDFIPSSFHNPKVNIDNERIRLYKLIFNYLTNISHYNDTIAYVSNDKHHLIITFERGNYD